MLNTGKLKIFCEKQWDFAVLSSIADYIRIPNLSPAFDPAWSEHGFMEQAVSLLEEWARDKIGSLPGATLDIIRLEGRTPLIFIDLPGQGDKNDDCVLLYGHLDKQPEMEGWQASGPWEPRRDGDRLYGRGAADDGYAMYAAITALLALAEQEIPRARCVILIEACEESGSYDLPFYIEHLSPRLGRPSLVICLDSGCGSYDRLWLTTSLRGVANGTLTVRVLTEGVHIGNASGVAPSSFRILRQLLSRVEDEATGAIRLQDLYVQIPPQRIVQAKQAAGVLGRAVFNALPFAGAAQPVVDDPTELVLNRSWRPWLDVTGMAGYPAPDNAGAVMLPYSSAKLSFRLPPTANAQKAIALIKSTLEADPPYDAQVEFDAHQEMWGWNAPALAPWLERSVAEASQMAFGNPPAFLGEGGAIPFMAMLAEKFPQTQFVVTGVLGPHSNAHGPNEFLHIPAAKHVTMAIARVVADHYAHCARS